MLRSTILAFLLALPAIGGAAGQPPTGRWEGTAQIPGRDLRLIIDLARNSGDAWSGSMIIPGFGVKGAPLTNIVVGDSSVAFELANALGAPPYGPATFKAALAGERMTGEMRQAGNTTKFALTRVGPSQVESPPRSTPIARELEAQWEGEFELGGYPRHVTVTLENHAGGGATAKLIIVGKQTNNIPVDLVMQEGNSLRIESSPNQVAFEGRVDGERREIRGTFELGPFELPLTLRRGAGGAS
jgi:hypothetical protein